MKPDEGEDERGEGRGMFGDSSSGGGSVFPRLGAICGGSRANVVPR